MVKLLVSTCLLVLTAAGHPFGQQLTQSQCPDTWDGDATENRPEGNSCTPGCEECDQGLTCMYSSSYKMYQWDVGTCKTADKKASRRLRTNTKLLRGMHAA